MRRGALAMWKSLAPRPIRAARTSTVSGDEKRWLAPSATPWDEVDGGSLGPAEALVMACHRDMYRYRHAGASLEGEAEFLNAYERTACPRCGSDDIRKWGHDSNGVRRWECKSCGRSFTPTTGTIFEAHKIPVADWTEFLIEVFAYESVNGMTRANRRSDTTLPYWLAKLFAVLAGVQDGVVLSGDVQIDEKFYPIARADQQLGRDGTRLRGLSRNQICIAVACAAGRSVFVEAGRGKPSKARAWGAYGPHIAEGSHLVHDQERSHAVLVERLGLRSTSYNSKEISKLPDKDNPLRDVNRLCFLLELFLNSHSSFGRDKLGGYLDLFHVMMNPPKDKMEKAALVLNRAMSIPKTLAFREFYKKKRR